MAKNSSQAYSLSGRITDQQNQPIEGLIVRAFDQDPQTPENPLGQAATTDVEGNYSISFTDKDFKVGGVESGGPDVFIRVYAGDQFLGESPVKRNSKKTIKIDLKVEYSRESAQKNDEVKAHLKIKAKHLEIASINGFSEPRLPGFINFDSPGAPSLPSQVHYITLPMGGEIIDIEVHPGEPIIIRDMGNPYPVQELIPDLGTNPDEFGNGVTFKDTVVKFTPLSKELAREFPVYPPRLVERKEEMDKDPIRIARVKVNPLQYNFEEKAYYFYPNLTYKIKFDEKEAARINQAAQRKWGAAEIELIKDIVANDLVFSANELYIPGIYWFYEEAAHIIITDNYRWPEHIEQSDGTLRSPSLAERGLALSGDLKAEFERLAQWKTSRGVKSKVVTISDIVAGNYGDMTKNGFARDLQEVIRNFIKFAYNRWQTRYVLLGGDYNVVPVRILTGTNLHGTVGTHRSSNNPPNPDECHILSANSVAKIRPQFVPDSTDPLSSYHGGVRIPFNREAGSGQLGWYYTSESSFNTRNSGFRRLPIGQVSNFIIVEGPASIIDDDYYWVREVNRIPSDLYYSSLFGSGYDQVGKHDFDLNNNGLYGQFHWHAGEDVSLDGVNTFPDVFPGRAAVESAAEAKAFVDKTITYERRIDQDGNYVDSSYFKKIIYGADLWGGFGYNGRQIDSAVPPAEGFFTHALFSTRARINLKFDITMTGATPSHRLVARSGGTDSVILYRTTASTTNPGWYFATNNNYNVQSAIPTRFIVVRGPASLVSPDDFIWDAIGMEGAINEKETLRGLMNGWFPAFNRIQRFYADYFDVSAPPALEKLEAAPLRAAIDEGVHFLSLTGHGWWGGCCGVDTYGNPDFKNKNQYFVAFADSCSTAHFDGPDSTAEVTTNDPDGGAIAYVGNTRYSWIGIGHHFEKFFWNKLSVVKRPGVAAGFREATGGPRYMWTVYAQNLFGDPELQVYTKVPPPFFVLHPDLFKWGEIVKVSLNEEIQINGDHFVTLSAGWDEKEQQSLLQITVRTNADGTAEIELPKKIIEGIEELTLTVFGRNREPYVKKVRIA